MSRNGKRHRIVAKASGAFAKWRKKRSRLSSRKVALFCKKAPKKRSVKNQLYTDAKTVSHLTRAKGGPPKNSNSTFSGAAATTATSHSHLFLHSLIRRVWGTFSRESSPKVFKKAQTGSSGSPARRRVSCGKARAKARCVPRRGTRPFRRGSAGR